MRILKNYKDVLKNISWLALDEVLKILVAILISAWVARHFGPETFGIWTYSLSLFGIFKAISTLGMDRIVIMEYALKERETVFIFYNSLITRGAGALFSFLIFVGVIFTTNDSSKVIYTSLILAFGLFPDALFQVLGYYYRNLLEAKRIVMSRRLGSVLSNGFKVATVLKSWSVINLAVAQIIEYIVSVIILFVHFNRRHDSIKSSYSFEYVKSLFLRSFPIWIGFLSVIIYHRSSQLFLKEMVSFEATGIYGISSRIFDLFYSANVIILSSLFPKMISSYRNNQNKFFLRVEAFLTGYTLIGYASIIGIYLFGEFILLLLFGSQYADSYQVLRIQIVGILFLFNGSIRNSYLINLNKQSIFAYATISGLILNFILNYLLVPEYGLTGAAWSNVLTIAYDMVVYNLFWKETRKLLKYQIQAFALFGIGKTIRLLKGKL